MPKSEKSTERYWMQVPNSSTGTCRNPRLLQHWDRTSHQPSQAFLTSTATKWFLEREKKKVTDVSTKMPNFKWTCWQLKNQKVVQAKPSRYLTGYTCLSNTWEVTQQLTSSTSSHGSPLPLGYVPPGTPSLSQGQAQCPPEADGESSPLVPACKHCSAHSTFGVRWLFPSLIFLFFFFNPSTRFSPLFVVFQSTQSFVLCLLWIFTITPSCIHISIAPQLHPAS